MLNEDSSDHDEVKKYIGILEQLSISSLIVTIVKAGRGF